jgi:hypothetical protein
MIECLQPISPRIKTEQSQQFFEAESQRLVECLIATRLLVLQTLRERNPELTFFEWFCFQRSRWNRNLFSEIFMNLSKYPSSVSSKIYFDLKMRFTEDGGRVIFDESQYLLQLLKWDYHSTNSSSIIDGRFESPRSFFFFSLQMYCPK